MAESRVPDTYHSTLLPPQGQKPESIWVWDPHFCLSECLLWPFLSRLVESFPITFLGLTLWFLFPCTSRMSPRICLCIFCNVHVAIYFCSARLLSEARGKEAFHEDWRWWRKVVFHCAGISTHLLWWTYFSAFSSIPKGPTIISNLLPVSLRGWNGRANTEIHCNWVSSFTAWDETKEIKKKKEGRKDRRKEGRKEGRKEEREKATNAYLVGLLY